MSTISARCFGTTGPTVVLVHGWCCGGDFWRGQVAAFADRYRLIVLDLGHPDPATDDLSMSAVGAEVAELIAPDSETCAILGHSMGGPIALEAAIRLGERCRLVVGVDTFTDAAFYRGLCETEVAARLAPFRGNFRGTMKAMVKRIGLDGLSETLMADVGHFPMLEAAETFNRHLARILAPSPGRS